MKPDDFSNAIDRYLPKSAPFGYNGAESPVYRGSSVTEPISHTSSVTQQFGNSVTDEEMERYSNTEQLSNVTDLKSGSVTRKAHHCNLSAKSYSTVANLAGISPADEGDF